MNKEPEFVNQIVDLYESGKSQKEIVEATCQTYSVVRYWLKKRGIYDPERRVHNLNHAHQAANQNSRQEAESRLALFLLDKGYFYIDGYKGKNSHILAKCLTCGETFTKYVDCVSKLKTISCPMCAEKRRADRLVSFQHTSGKIWS